jgi:hypothetical protein
VSPRDIRFPNPLPAHAGRSLWYTDPHAKEKGDRVRKACAPHQERKRGDWERNGGPMEKRLDRKMAEGFSTVNRRLDTIIQIQLDQHAGRIKKLETTVFSK